MKKINNKKGLSEIVGYVILVVIAVSLAVLVYNWLKLQLPQEKPQCSENLGLIIKEMKCNAETDTINLTLSNKGFFNIEGVNIRIANETNGAPAHVLTQTAEGEINNEGYFYFEPALQPNLNLKQEYSYAQHNKIRKIQIIPFIYEKKIGSNKQQIVLCSNSKIVEDISCD